MVQGDRHTQVIANDNTVVGGQVVYMSQSDMFLQSAMKVSSTAQNNATNGGLPTQIANEMISYNGKTQVLSTDATGVAMESELLLDGTIGTFSLGVAPAGSMISSISGTVANVSIEAPIIQLGGTSAVQPMVLGTTFVALMSTIMTMLDTHVHPTAAPGPPSPPLLPTLSATWGGGVSTLSTTVFGV